MATRTMLPSHRKLNLPLNRRDGDSQPLSIQHPLSPHEVRPPSDKQTNNKDDPMVLSHFHPLSPHTTCDEDDQAQSVNEMDINIPTPSRADSVPHPLSPHTTCLERDAQTGRALSSASTDTSVDAVKFTPSTSSASSITPRIMASADLTWSTTAQASTTSEDRQLKTILLINGPNLNLLGHREPHIYGSTTLADITQNLTNEARTHGIKLLHFQSNHEGAILDRIHACLLGAVPQPLSSTEYPSQAQPPPETKSLAKPDAIIINPGALTHTSVALRDALLGISVPFIEVHISNVHAREQFRHHSYLSDKAEAVIAGLGIEGYEAAVRYWARKWTTK